MRLIDCQTFSLVEVEDPTQIQYAILSHTWEYGQEVQFDEFKKQGPTAKTGWRKIKRLCSLAAADGYQFAWCDTCCIDKTSSAELTEAINSMFLWYAASDVCYVYLADYDASRPGCDLAASKWFTRGWTLQELIAPAQVRFYDASWSEIGTKATLSSDLSTITGIEENILLALEDQDLNSILSEVPIARRMAWGAKRQTTRTEDMAYSLLGIFGVNLPLMYGEGERAFIRLQEEIIRNSNDMSLLAWLLPASSSSSRPDNYSGVLARHPRDFQRSEGICQTSSIMFNPEFTMTNKGIRITAPLSYDQQEDLHVLFLNCHNAATPDKILGIYLKNQGASVFVRARPQEFASNLVAASDNTERKLLFLSKLLSSRAANLLHRVHRCSFVVPDLKGPLSQSWSTGVVEPEALWDSGQRMFITAGLQDFVGYYEYLDGVIHSEVTPANFFLIFGYGYGFKPWLRVMSHASNVDIIDAVKRGNLRMAAKIAVSRASNKFLADGRLYKSNPFVPTSIVARLKSGIKDGEPVFIVSMETRNS